MNRTVFALPARSEYRSRAGLLITRVVEQFTGGANRLDDLVSLLDRRRGVVLSSGTTVPGRYDSFDLGFSDPPLKLETVGFNFTLEALNARGQVLISFLAEVLREPCVVISEKTPSRLAGHIITGDVHDRLDRREITGVLHVGEARLVERLEHRCATGKRGDPLTSRRGVADIEFKAVRARAQRVGAVNQHLAGEIARLLQHVVHPPPGHRDQHHIRVARPISRRSRACASAGAPREARELARRARVREHHVVPRAREERAELPAEQAGAEDRDAHDQRSTIAICFSLYRGPATLPGRSSASSAACSLAIRVISAAATFSSR